MKRNLNYTAALATTAAVALLAGAAHAQMGGTPQVCTTTQNSPAHNDCVMPTASAPGGGSFPGSFLVPGTNTSFAVHGYIQFELTRDLGPHAGDDSIGIDSVPLEGSGVTSTVAHSANGGITMGIKPTRPNIETRTPTAYGELKTYIEFDFNQTSGSQLGGNADLLRLRQAYGTLGPWLIGQADTLWEDAQTWADIAQGGQDVGIMNSGIRRRPQIRYTWLAGKGLSVAGSAELPTYNAALGNQIGFAKDGSALGTASANETTSYSNTPHFVGAVQWDQPWGHIRFAAMGGISDYRATTAVAGAPADLAANTQNAQWGLRIGGHLNTWGKDALRGGFWYNHGGADYSAEMVQGGELFNQTTGARAATKEWAAYATYEHFFNGQWRANESFGYGHLEGNPGWTSAVTLSSLNSNLFTNEVNVIYSPVPQTDFIMEWQHFSRHVQSGANGVQDRIDFQSKFYF
ncbi:MAG: porin [Alphaproteobacteria bacterium]|nr:porin [Alphaproteobacteria bacterium]